jgi:hypothetical protein
VSTFLLHTMSESDCRISCLKLQFQALIVEDGASHSGVGEVNDVADFARFRCRSNRRFASPRGDQPDFTQPIMSEFRTNSGRAVSFSRDLHLLSAPA